MKIKSICLIFVINFFFYHSTCKAQWQEVYFDSTYSVTDIFCLNSDTCFITLNTGINNKGKILKTLDGGISWNTLINDTTKSFGPVYFINDSVGFLTGGDSIYRTYDGGNSWVTLIGLCNGFRSRIIKAFNNDTVILEGFCNLTPDSISIFITTDGGANLSPIYLPYSCLQTNNYHIKAEFLNDSTCIGGSIIDECVYKTNDYGFTWNKIHENCNNATGTFIRDISFYNDTMGWLGGILPNYLYNLKYTTDGGYTWNEYLGQVFGGISAIKFFADGTGYVGEGNIIYKTTDYGITFNPQYTLQYLSFPNLGEYFNQFCFLNSQVGYITASNSVLKTTNGGGVGINESHVGSNYLSIYPNPTAGICTLNLPLQLAVNHVLVFDLLGKEVIQSTPFKTYPLQLDLSALVKGMYVVRVSCESATFMGRVVVE